MKKKAVKKSKKNVQKKSKKRRSSTGKKSNMSSPHLIPKGKKLVLVTNVK